MTVSRRTISNIGLEDAKSVAITAKPYLNPTPPESLKQPTQIEIYNTFRANVYESVCAGFDDVKSIRRYARRNGLLIPLHNRMLAYYMSRDRNIEVIPRLGLHKLAIYKFVC